MHHASEENAAFGFDVTLYSDKFTYKYKDYSKDKKSYKEKRVNVNVRSNEFLEIVKNILEYKK